MKKEINSGTDRRDFLKAAGAAGLGTAFSLAGVKAETDKAKDKSKKTNAERMPKRILGKTGIEVPVLALGGGVNFVDNQILLRKAYEWGVRYWDTAPTYEGGLSEQGIGIFLGKNPQLRKKIILTTKASGARTIAQTEEVLQKSLKTLNTNYIDIYYGIHGLSNPAQLTDDMRQWVESAKKRKLIRAFGFSTHKNAIQCLQAAAKFDWVDVAMPGYNFRLMQDGEMQAGIEACHKAGIGIVAMKVMGHAQKVYWKGKKVTIETEKDKKLAKPFVEAGFTNAQAKIKLVLTDERISTACVRNENIRLLNENIAAVLDTTKLSQAQEQILARYARATCSGYCAGCAEICDAALPGMPYVSDIMRYLMYNNSYGDVDRAKQLFAEIPAEVRRKLTSIDYSKAEARCPQRMPIAKLVGEAVEKLA